MSIKNLYLTLMCEIFHQTKSNIAGRGFELKDNQICVTSDWASYYLDYNRAHQSVLDIIAYGQLNGVNVKSLQDDITVSTSGHIDADYISNSDLSGLDASQLFKGIVLPSMKAPRGYLLDKDAILIFEDILQPIIARDIRVTIQEFRFLAVCGDQALLRLDAFKQSVKCTVDINAVFKELTK